MAEEGQAQSQPSGQQGNPLGEQIAKLTDILGWDPGRSPAPTAALLKQALDEINKERTEKALGMAKEKLQKAIQLREEFAKTERQFNQAKQQFQKELGKILKSVEALSKGEPEQEAEEPKAS